MSPTPARGEPYWNPLIGIFHIFRQLPANKISERWQHPLAQIPICRGWKMAEASQGTTETLSSRSSRRLKRAGWGWWWWWWWWCDRVRRRSTPVCFCYSLSSYDGGRQENSDTGWYHQCDYRRPISTTKPLTLPLFLADKNFRFFRLSG